MYVMVRVVFWLDRAVLVALSWMAVVMVVTEVVVLLVCLVVRQAVSSRIITAAIRYWCRCVLFIVSMLCLSCICTKITIKRHSRYL